MNTEELTETFYYGNNIIVVHWPVLTDAEAAQRERQVGYALEAYMKDYLIRKEKSK